MKSSRNRPALAALAGLGLIGSLAACATTATEAAGGTESSTGTSATDTGAAATDDVTTDTDTGDSSYVDGDYSAEGSYQSPGGSETIGVSITIEDDVVTAVTVTPEADRSDSIKYQTAFASGIADEVVGKAIDELSVSVVAGSSLTSEGFNAALESIKADALA